jgi:DNA replicative helicase MCM subunit Mcm2 (Cdc46/Mcm family)
MLEFTCGVCGHEGVHVQWTARGTRPTKPCPSCAECKRDKDKR